MAADVRARVDKEQTTFSASVHRDHVEQMVGILGDIVAHPRFDAAEFARLRDAAINDVEKRLRQGDDENLGKEALGELMFRGHAYGRLTLGHVADLRKLTLDDVKRQAARVFTLDRLTIGVAGGYTARRRREAEERGRRAAGQGGAAGRDHAGAAAPAACAPGREGDGVDGGLDRASRGR